jgi:hypothetical protein
MNRRLVMVNVGLARRISREKSSIPVAYENLARRVVVELQGSLALGCSWPLVCLIAAAYKNPT